jgi:hypothetical protein
MTLGDDFDKGRTVFLPLADRFQILGETELFDFLQVRCIEAS